MRSEVRRAVVAAAGLGTRLLPATKEQPKEMLPLFAPSAGGGLCLKPLLQLIFEQLYDAGVRDFCFVVGRGKRSIEDHFTPDYGFLGYLEGRGKREAAAELDAFYRRLENATIMWVNQSSPRGFGDAVLRAEGFARGEPFLVHAGDTYIGPGVGHLRRLGSAFFGLGADAALLTREVEDPGGYGVVLGEPLGDGLLRVSRAVEKPKEPISRTAILPVYVFQPSIFEALRGAPPGHGGELQLTDGIQRLADAGGRVVGVELHGEEARFDVGNVASYAEALAATLKKLTQIEIAKRFTNRASNPERPEA